jgi:FMN phosphatase YigB (HAD superfamily)
MNVTGNANQINTGKVAGDMRNVYIGGDPGSDPRVLAAQATLTKLTEALDAHADEVHSIDSCRRAVTRIDEELRSPAPDARRLAEVLETLTLAIGSAASVVHVADSLKNAIETMLS